MTDKAGPTAPPFAIFRAADAGEYGDGVTMTPRPPSALELQGAERMREAGVMDGTTVKVLYARPGMSLSYAWFKSGFPLPRHSHDAECLYFIVAGSLRIGTEELGAGDGFFVGANVPYAYTPGDDGVEVLEFRTADTFDIKLFANSSAYWDKAMSGLLAARDHWPQEAPPSGLAVG